MAVYIASGTTAADGADFPLADGAAATLNLFSTGTGVPGSAVGTIQIKASSGVYLPIGTLDQGSVCVQVFGPGIYRVSKNATTVAFGVDKS